MTAARGGEPGWTRIGLYDSAERRSLWIRVEWASASRWGGCGPRGAWSRLSTDAIARLDELARRLGLSRSGAVDRLAREAQMPREPR